MRGKQRSRLIAGVALGVGVALLGPLGIAVGTYSHPVGTYSHPYRPSGSISGVVYDERGPADDCLIVGAYNEARELVSRDWVSSSGVYHVRRLPTGDYRLLFESDWDYCDEGDVYRSEWYRDRTSFDTADPIHVEDGFETMGIDATVESLPRPDMAVTDLSARTERVGLASGPKLPAGWVLRIDTAVANLGEGMAYGRLSVWAEGAEGSGMPSRRAEIGSDSVHLTAGERVNHTYYWDAPKAGDVTIHSCVEVWSPDASPNNNERAVRASVLVSGTGLWIALPTPPGDSPGCDWFYAW